MRPRQDSNSKDLATVQVIQEQGEASADAGLADLGYAPQLQRTRGQFAIQCLLFSLFAVPFGYSTGFYTGLLGGGSVSILWGFCLVGVMQEFVAISLGELSSRFPTSSGPFYWTYQLSPPSVRVPLSYVTGVIYMLAIWMLDLGTHWGTASILVGCINIYLPDYVAPTWVTFLIAYGLYAWSFLTCYYWNKQMGLIDAINAAVTFASIIAIFITLLAVHKNGFNSGAFVFGNYRPDFSGWGQGWTFFIGLLPGCFVMCGVGMITSLSEEVEHPEIQVPRAMVIGIPAATLSGILLAVSMLFTCPSVEDLLAAPGGQPVAYILKTVTGSNIGGLLLFMTVLSSAVIACTANQFAASRTTWAFARDRALPCHNWISKVDKRQQPLNALIVATVAQMLFACIAFGSTAAINAFLGVGIIGAELSYGLPIAINLFTRRRLIAGAPFHLGVFGMISNIASCIWMALCLVIFCMPTVIPVNLLSMNWASVVLVGCLTLSAVWYFVAARHTYTGPPASAALFHQEAEDQHSHQTVSEGKVEGQ
ncbi:putative gaba permease [Meredithblackwellia eburnea MCA 4105]